MAALQVDEATRDCAENQATASTAGASQRHNRVREAESGRHSTRDRRGRDPRRSGHVSNSAHAWRDPLRGPYHRSAYRELEHTSATQFGLVFLATFK